MINNRNSSGSERHLCVLKEEEEGRTCTFLRGEWRGALKTAAARLGVLVWSRVVLRGPGLLALTQVPLRFLGEWWRWRCCKRRRRINRRRQRIKNVCM